jgi:hypothetical protein
VLVFGLIGAVVLLAGGTVFGVNAYAKNEICSAMKSDPAPTASGSDATAGTAAQMRRAAGDLRRSARMLVIDRDLHNAVDGLADDLDQLATITGQADDATSFASIMTLATSANSHATQAQTACGLPAVGIFPN